jgi:hypothetical protein
MIEKSGGNSLQYVLQMNSYTSYSIREHTGALNYNRSTKVIEFTSGPIKGYKGIYRPVNPTNPNDPPTIVIDFEGKVPVLNQHHTDTYLYGYWHG